jgi:nucleoside-diphosphate-sugar epimerase
MAAARLQPRFVLTGPSGWIGGALLAHIAGRFGGRLDDRVLAFASSERTMTLPWGESLAVRALESIRPEDVAGAHVVHLAYLTKEKAERQGERRFFDTNLAIDDAVLAALEGGPASLFVASSGAAKLAAEGLDLHPYGVAKLRQEARFLQWGRDTGVPVIAGRIFNVAGPYINKLEAYAISNFAVQAREKGAISIAANVPVFRSFLHVDDLCGLIVGAAINGVAREHPVDLCGAQILEMQDIAQAVASACGNRATVTRPALDCRRPSSYLGNHVETRSLAIELGVPLTPFATQVADTVAWVAPPTADEEAIGSPSQSTERDCLVSSQSARAGGVWG